jgi:uncharacterized protein YdaU (DUF1376 family)
MGIIKWYKRDPNAALTGMASLTLEERGAYNTVLDLIYAHGGAVDDDYKFIAGWLRVDVRVWRRIRQRLIDDGKLYVNGPGLRNARADREIDAAQHRYLSAAEAARSKHAKSKVETNLLKNLAPATAHAPALLTRIQNKNLTSSPLSISPRAREDGGVEGLADQKQPATASAELIALSRRRGWVQ